MLPGRRGRLLAPRLFPHLSCVWSRLLLEPVGRRRPRWLIDAKPIVRLFGKRILQFAGGSAKEDREVSERRLFRLNNASVWQGQNNRIAGTENFLKAFLQARGEPALTKVVVDYKVAIRLEVAADVFERLTCEQKTL